MRYSFLDCDSENFKNTVLNHNLQCMFEIIIPLPFYNQLYFLTKFLFILGRWSPQNQENGVVLIRIMALQRSRSNAGVRIQDA